MADNEVGDADLSALELLLGWNSPVPMLSSVQLSTKGGPGPMVTEHSAICFDSNVFLNVGKGAKAADLIDYLSQQHKGPIIISSQTLVEFWNNYFSGTETFTDNLKKHAEALDKAIVDIAPTYDKLRQSAETMVSEFRSEFGHLASERTHAEISSFLTMLESTGLYAQVPRELISRVSRVRQGLKMPPGFKDDGNGDLAVWAEMLLGLQIAERTGRVFDSVVFVTAETKKDWITRGVPHPALIAEVAALTGGKLFWVKTLEKLRSDLKDANLL